MLRLADVAPTCCFGWRRARAPRTIILRRNSSTADFFVDGYAMTSSNFRDLQVDRVEARKGPNAMISGAAAPGGHKPRNPAGEMGHRAEVALQAAPGTTARDLRRRPRAKHTVASGSRAVRIGSYRDGVELERQGINPTAAFRLGEDTVLRVSYEYFDYDRTADRGIPSLDGVPIETDEGTFFGDPRISPTRATVNLASVVLDHAFNDDVRIRNRTLYADYDKFYQNVFPGAVDALAGTVTITAYNNEQLRENVFNQTDLTFSAVTGAVRHGFLVGAELGVQVTDNFRNTGFFNDTTTSVQAPLGDPTISVPVTFRQSTTDADNHSRATVAAFYVQDQIEITPQFEAVIGLRYDHFDVNSRNNRTGDEFSSTDALLSPRAGLIYKPAATSRSTRATA